MLLGILGNLGGSTGAVEMMMRWHLVFDRSAVGIVAGMLEAAVVAVVVCWPFVWLSNVLASRA